eukprot:TRINITY_DN14531_c0_g3_i1.p2 TRINITY_DN14531_c0_g3~~TRINITY_DN14531_c0_g3_i1.p2  ORF type:complete len:224 (-),score=65.68 TRINITY_DN14531_c0_g3_i1:126-797(-)
MAAVAEASGGSTATDGGLRDAVEAALKLSAEDRKAAVPAAVCTLLGASSDRAEDSRRLQRLLASTRAQLPADAGDFLDAVAAALRAVELGCSSEEVAGSDAACCSSSAAAAAGEEEESEAESESSEANGSAFRLGPVPMPLTVLLNITSAIEPDELNAAAACCKSFCIPININLQYMLFLVRLMRLIVLGPELARAMNEAEGDDASTTSGEEEGEPDEPESSG